MKLVCLSDDYVDYLFDNLERMYYPFKNDGFNMSFAKIDNQRELYTFRNVITFKSLYDKNNNKGKRYVPGLEPRQNALANDFYVESDFSDNFIWSWKYYYEVYIFFVGNLQEDGHIKIDRKVKPEALLNPYYIYNLPKRYRESFPTGTRLMKREDFRIYNIKGKLFMMDSMINTLSEIKVEKDKIILSGRKMAKYQGICEYNEEKEAENKAKGIEKYYKIFEKNWSLYKFAFVDKKPTFYFFHDYSEEGLESVSYNREGCQKSILIKYKGDTVPYDNNAFARFSFGSTILMDGDYCYGVGHTKFLLKKPKSEIEKKFNRLKKMADVIHTEMRKIFKSKYKVHREKMYGYYFFRYNAKKKEFLISDTFIPLIMCNDYIFSLCFPMSIVSKHRHFYVSMGYGDYTNVMARYTKDEIDKSLVHDIENFKLSTYKVTVTYEDSK